MPINSLFNVAQLLSYMIYDISTWQLLLKRHLGGGKFDLFGRYLFIDLLDTHSSKHTCFLSFFLQLHNLKLNFTPHNMYKCTVDRLIGLTTLNRDFVKLKLNRYICVCASDMILGESNFMVWIAWVNLVWNHQYWDGAASPLWIFISRLNSSIWFVMRQLFITD